MTYEVREFGELILGYLPVLLAALAVLVLGWVAALIIMKVTRSVLHRVSLNTRLARWVFGQEQTGAADTGAVNVEDRVAKGVFYLLMLFVLVAFFQVLGLTLVTEPINRLLNQLFQFLPQLVGAGVLLLTAWIVASALRVLISRVLEAMRLDERFSTQAGVETARPLSLSKSLAETVYWLVLLLFLPAVLNALALEGLLAPVQGMLDKVLGILPNIFTAVIILLVGWFLARIVQRIVTNLLAAVGADAMSERIGLSRFLGSLGLSGILGLVVYILILIPVLVASLNALALEAITQPASNMLNTLLAALPALFAAALVLVLAYVVGRVIAGLTTDLLTGVGFNGVLSRIGIAGQAQAGGRTPSEIAGFLVLVTIMLFAIIEAARQLGFVLLASLVADFTVFAGHIVLGVIIFAIGLYLADLASRTLQGSGAVQAGLLATTSKVAIIVLSGAIALRQMGLANDIISLAFGLLFGAVMVAVALALGLGGRDIAARELAQWVDTIKSKRTS